MPKKATKALLAGKKALVKKSSAGKVAAKALPKLKRQVPRPVEPVSPQSGAVVLDRLWSVITARREADPAVSHSARLLSRGMAKVAQKFGEEAVECLIEAVAGNAELLVAESADVLYHLLVVWVAAGVAPEAVWAELMRREGVSGVAEKAARIPARGRGLATRKIP